MIMWLTGLSGSGKTTLAQAVFKEARKFCPNVVMLDGDIMREIWGNDLGYTREDRLTNATRCSRLCLMLERQDIHVVAAFIAPYREMRMWNRENFRDYYEVYIQASRDVLVNRDSKGLYRKALENHAEVVGMNHPFEIPENPNETIKNNGALETFLSNAARLAHILAKSV